MRDEQRPRLRVEECAREARERLRALAPPAAVLQAERITQSASSFKLAISEAVK